MWNYPGNDRSYPRDDEVYQKRVDDSWAWVLDPATDWSKFHTRQLLKLLQELRWNDGPTNVLELRDKLKEILATREHIPGGAERKAIRQQKAKTQRSR